MIYHYQEITPEIRRPIIPIFLKHKEKFIFYDGLIDSGSDYCIFSIEFAKVLNIPVSKRKVSFIGVGKEKVSGHLGEVEARIGELTYKLKAIFAQISDFGHGILGHKGFFDHFDVRLSYKNQTIELEPISIYN